MSATILIFDGSRRRPQRHEPGVSLGEVLIYSGVRYERHVGQIEPPPEADRPLDPLDGGGNTRRTV